VCGPMPIKLFTDSTSTSICIFCHRLRPHCELGLFPATWARGRRWRSLLARRWRSRNVYTTALAELAHFYINKFIWQQGPHACARSTQLFRSQHTCVCLGRKACYLAHTTFTDTCNAQSAPSKLRMTLESLSVEAFSFMRAMSPPPPRPHIMPHPVWPLADFSAECYGALDTPASPSPLLAAYCGAQSTPTVITAHVSQPAVCDTAGTVHKPAPISMR